MRMKRREIALGALIVALGAPPVLRSQAGDQASRFAGTWRGDSVCIAKNTACHNEVVVYRVQKLPAPDHVTISADKVVNGTSINMGSLEFHYEQQIQSWVCHYPPGVWRLKVRGTEVNGTLTQPDGSLLRQLSLRKDR
jgi:hypothetical protein